MSGKYGQVKSQVIKRRSATGVFVSGRNVKSTAGEFRTVTLNGVKKPLTAEERKALIRETASEVEKRFKGSMRILA